MNVNEATLLQRAFRRGNLRGALVHMTPYYFDDDNNSALGFAVAKTLLETLRANNIACMHFLEKTAAEKTHFSTKDLHNIPGRDRPHNWVHPTPDEHIFGYNTEDATINPALKAHLKSQANSNFICAGMYSHTCVRLTAAGILKTLPKSHVFIATDASESEPIEEEYEEDLTDREKGRMHYATTAQITSVIALGKRDLL